MANTPKLIKIPGPFLDAVERLLQVAPPPKTKKAKTVTAKGIKQTRKRPSAAGTAKRKMTRKAR